LAQESYFGFKFFIALDCFGRGARETLVTGNSYSYLYFMFLCKVIFYGFGQFDGYFHRKEKAALKRAAE
jgi:hypothetical protein